MQAQVPLQLHFLKANNRRCAYLTAFFANPDVAGSTYSFTAMLAATASGAFLVVIV